MVLTTIIGQCVGGAHYDRAKDYLKCALGYGCGLLVILSVLVVGFSKQLSGLFVKSDAVAAIVGTYFLIVSVGYILNTVTNCYLGALNGMGKPSKSMFLMIFYYIVVRMPLAYLLSYKNRSRTACTMHSIKHNRLEAAVLFAVQQQVHLAVSYSEMIASINTAPVKKSQSIRLEELIAAKERELAKISRYKQSLYQDWKDGEITQQDYRDMKADYERQTIALTDVLARLNAERAELANGVKSEHPALVAFTKHQNIDQLSRELLVELIDHIKVYENGNISVRFKFADEFRRIAEYIEINTTKPAVAG